FANAGQVCISTQRVLAERKVYGDYLDALKPAVEKLTLGDQLHEQTQVGPMVREQEAVRVQDWISEAGRQGAKVITGGTRQGALHAPTVVAEVQPEMRIACDELFGPAVAVSAVGGLEEAITTANATKYGLAAAIFTQDIDKALAFARRVDAGNLHIN